MSGAVVPRPPEHQSAIKSISPIRLPTCRIRALALKNADKFAKKKQDSKSMCCIPYSYNK
jgi:hypothetical protein